MNKRPNASQSENLPSWQMDEMAEVGCLESGSTGLGPLIQTQPVIAQSAVPVLEDGKKSEATQSPCVESRPAASAPGASVNEVFRPQIGQIIENVKMDKKLA